MVYIVFSDVHGNLEAMQAFLEIAGGIVHDRKVCLGDIVGYGADPNACIDLVRDNADIILAGNHDYAVVGKTDPSYFNAYAYQACVWTRDELTGANKEFLSSLPVRMQTDGISWVHSSPFEPLEWHYIVSPDDGVENFGHFDTSICFVGHSHVPLILLKKPGGEIGSYVQPSWRLQPDSRHIVNVGSIGQPRDGNPEPCFVIYDTESMTVEFRRFDYDRPTAQQKILQNGLPAYLAHRLSTGV